MAYKKFDDPDLRVDATGRKVYSTFDERFRRAIQGVANRVVGSTTGTGGSPDLAHCMAGGTGGCQIGAYAVVRINGLQGTITPQVNLDMPYGTQLKNTVAKYLISTSSYTGSAGTVTGPGNVIKKADYTTIALAEAATKLPDLPDGHCALGYMLYHTPTLLDVVHNAAVIAGGTQGTATFQNLVCMPYDG